MINISLTLYTLSYQYPFTLPCPPDSHECHSPLLWPHSPCWKCLWFLGQSVWCLWDIGWLTWAGRMRGDTSSRRQRGSLADASCLRSVQLVVSRSIGPLDPSRRMWWRRGGKSCLDPRVGFFHHMLSSSLALFFKFSLSSIWHTHTSSHKYTLILISSSYG